MEDCDYRAPTTGNRKAAPGCDCDRCEALREARRKRRKVANMTAAQREKKNAAQRAENISADRRERRNAAQRVKGMTPAQLKKHREAGAKRSRLHRERRATERAGDDCGHRSSANTRRPKRGCKCPRCVELRGDRNTQRRVGVISDEQREQRNALQRFENLPEEQQERRRARQRVENMTPAQLKKHREASAERQRRARERRKRGES
jgi:methylphosphotriester-DNA--protein-cysteine methyltransferase